MNEEALAFLSNYQKSLFTDKSETPSQRAGIQRKCLVQMFNHSLHTLNETSSLHLLEKNLLKYCEIVDNDPTKTTFMHDNRVKNALEMANINAPVPLKSNLADVDLRSLLKGPACYDSKDFRCKKSAQVNEKEFRAVLEALRMGQVQTAPSKQKQGKNTNPEPPLPRKVVTDFKSAGEEFYAQKKAQTTQKRKLGLRRNVNSKFVPPLLTKSDSSEDGKSEEWPVEADERLKNIEPKMVELIKSEIMDVGAVVQWGDIAGLEFAKTAIQEAVVWPLLRPDIFKGLRRPPKGILLFGPPGTGKTLIGKCVASQSKSTFFSISASSLTSKWVGEGEKMVRALFAVARCYQPAVIFIDEIDSLLSQRNETEHESSRRIKTEFLVQLDGATTDSEERLLVIGATNRPQELDEAARRRFVKRLYIPLPEFEARLQLVERLVGGERHRLAGDDFKAIARLSDGYSGADIRNLCSEASLGPIRSIDMLMIEKIKADEVRPLLMEDFQKAFTRVRSSVAPKDLEQYVVWDSTYGSGI